MRQVDLLEAGQSEDEAAADLEPIAGGDDLSELLEPVERRERRQVVARHVELGERALAHRGERVEAAQLEVGVAEVERRGIAERVERARDVLGQQHVRHPAWRHDLGLWLEERPHLSRRPIA